jgi:FtsP/CotA-like multicopper oxidase with cupredoxin domain
MSHGFAGKSFTSAILASAAMVLVVGVQAPSAMGLGSAPPGDPGGGGPSAAEIQQQYRDKAKAVQDKKDKQITTADRQLATAEALQAGAVNPLMVEAAATGLADAQAALVDGAPHYFSHPNYANSPLPTVNSGTVVPVGNALQDRGYSSDNATTGVFVTLPQDLPGGFLQSFQTWNQPDTGAPASAGLNFHAYVLRPTGNPNEFTVVFDSGQLTVPPLSDPAVGEIATFPVANLAVQAGDKLAFSGRGIPLDIGAGGDLLYYPSTETPLQDSTITVGVDPYPLYNQARTYSFSANVLDTSAAGADTAITGGMRKFVDPLPTLGAATPDTTSYPGADYYEIGLVEYTQRMHSDLAKETTLRGYVQLVPSTDPDAFDLGNGYYSKGKPTYLGPSIVAQKDHPVRITFRNLLPTGADGDLFLPVDSTVMGSGTTADGHVAKMDGAAPWDDPQNLPCSGPNKADLVAAGLCYADSRAVVHLHGGITPWISDGTPHQWITPAGESTKYPQGVSVHGVPDMPGTDAEDDGATTLYYTNQQSARLLFYHDHAWGITRLNVYAGMAAPYIIQDGTEQALVDAGTIPGTDATIPLVVQDKTFVPSDAQLAQQDETWDTTAWGAEGDLWAPHVYSPAQNPGDASGVNQYGRWAYGPWFWPPTNSIDHGPINNPYYDPACDPDAGWCEPPLMPGTPNNSMGMESFNDTPVVNGAAYPTTTVEPKAYRFRILNAANDRFFNLSMYQAIDADGRPCDAANPDPVAESTGVACTEVALNPDEVAAALDDPAGVFPTPVVGTEGPDWIQIGNEGGFLPTPTVIPAQPTTWVTDPTVFNAGNVDKHSLLVAPAERADVVVDFSQYAGQTLILYNDAPAAFPARDPRYDYYTGNPDLRDTGGAPSTLPGYGPNTRTVMQIKVAGTPDTAFDLDALTAAFTHQDDGSGVFESGQHPSIVGQQAYNSAYGTTFKGQDGLGQIYDTSLNFTTIEGTQLSMPLKGKMIQDEMGEAFEQEYGRMSGFLGVETPNPQAGQQNMILHPYVFPPTEIIDGVELPPGTEVTPIASADDGTQIWKITHNGVDTHPIHWHLYDVQLINRVGWDGIIRKPEPNELGWKDTIRVSPLEDTIVALRPIIPQLPTEWGGLPNSIRLLDPSMPEGEYIANTTQRQQEGLPILGFSPSGEPIDVVNHYVNFGWEYVYHCHILSHEEMDMMHAQAVAIAPAAPTDLTWTNNGSDKNPKYELTWNDHSKNETAFVIERRVAGTQDPYEQLAVSYSTELGFTPYVDSGEGPGTGTRTYLDESGAKNTSYEYRVYAVNTVGDVWDYADPALNNISVGGFPTVTLDSRAATAPALEAPSNLIASAAVKNKKSADVSLAWNDNSANETGFLVQRATDPQFTAGVTNETVAAGATSLTQTVGRELTFYYRVAAFSDTGQSPWSEPAMVTTP